MNVRVIPGDSPSTGRPGSQPGDGPARDDRPPAARVPNGDATGATGSDAGDGTITNRPSRNGRDGATNDVKSSDATKGGGTNGGATNAGGAPGSATSAAGDGRERQSIGDRLRALVTSGEKEPLYPRILRLKNVHPNGWQRAVLVEGMMLVGALAALADQATAWAPAVLPVAAAFVVKFHDVLAGVLRPASANTTAAPPARGDAAGADEQR